MFTEPRGLGVDTLGVTQSATKVGHLFRVKVEPVCACTHKVTCLPVSFITAVTCQYLVCGRSNSRKNSGWLDPGLCYEQCLGSSLRPLLRKLPTYEVWAMATQHNSE